MDTHPAFDPRTNGWRSAAACARSEDRDLFYPNGWQSRAAKTQVEEAKWFCRRCDVRNECLSEALANDEQYGIWGGLTTIERRDMVRRERAVRRLGRAAASS